MFEKMCNFSYSVILMGLVVVDIILLRKNLSNDHYLRTYHAIPPDLFDGEFSILIILFALSLFATIILVAKWIAVRNNEKNHEKLKKFSKHINRNL